MCKEQLVTLALCAFVAGLLVGPAAQAGDPALIAWWKLDDGAGTVALDSSDYGNHGTVMNPNAGLGAGGSVWVDDPDRGMVISFNGADGSGAYVTTGVTIPALTMDNGFTWTFWAKQPAAQATNNDVILGNRYGGTASPLQFCKFTPTRFENYNDDGAYANGINYTSIPSDVWIHHALVKDGAEMTYYRDGVVMMTNTMIKTNDPNPFYMGADGFSGVAENWQGYLSDVRLYARALTAKEVLDVMAGKGPTSEFATDPVPVHEAVDIPRDVVLNWMPGEYAATHDVYFGTAFADIEAASRANPMGVLLSQGQTATTYDPPGILELGQTYYWRVDEVNAAPDNTIYKGEVWSFTAEPVGYPIANVVASSNGLSDAPADPERTVDGSGLDAADQHSVENATMWLARPPADETLYVQFEFDRVYKLHEMLVWNHNSQFEMILGFGLKDVAVAFSEDGIDWTELGDVEFARATATANYVANTVVDFQGVPARYVRLTVNSGWGVLGQFGLSEVRFLYIPVQAREPQPSDGTAGIAPEATLQWRAGREAVSHDVYMGTDAEAMTLVGTADAATFAPGNLEFGSTYYWQIVEVNEAEEIAAWAGDIWSFATQEYALIEGFESYTDDIDAGEAIFDTWLDGWVNNTGSTVGHLETPFAERTIVRSGRQSMPLFYDNTTSPFYSEAERTFASPQNWTGYGANTLVVYFRGLPGSFMEQANGSIILGAAGADIWGTADEFRFAYKNLSGDGSIVAYVESIANTDPWAKGGVMIRETLEAGSRFAAVYSTPGNGCRYQARLTASAEAVSDSAIATAEQMALFAPHWVKIERVGNSFNGYYSTDGENWTAMSWNPQTIAMGANVYVGLALTSHAAGVLASAEFSGVTTTGNVSGQWAVETIGVAQPEGNAGAPLYVALEDATGNAATVTHPAGNAATWLAGWNAWPIPLSEFAGVNLSRVDTMVIGVGSRTNPTAGGTGIVYIDDIGYGRPASAE